jgi:endonuclease/exonuclease/phosphatase family metal-dependent hydrolase
MNRLVFILGLLFFLNGPVNLSLAKSNPDVYRVVFYNVENLFDTLDDPGKNDGEFLPNGVRYWNDRKLHLKLNRIFQVIMALGEGNHPAVIGLCEVENLNVLELLLSRTPLGRMGYKIVHKESPDRRGIDVALLYLPEKFKPVSYQAVPVTDTLNEGFKTRDILHVKGLIAADTIHFFVNHWPSKYGGLMETEASRALAAQTLRFVADSLFEVNQNSKMLIMGDMNDSPFDNSLIKNLKAKAPQPIAEQAQLYNLSYPLAKKGKGTIKHQGRWELIDHIIVSSALLNSKGLSASPDGFKIFEAKFLLEKDKTHLGTKPFRTYVGFKYNNGFSDHLPVYLDLKYVDN